MRHDARMVGLATDIGGAHSAGRRLRRRILIPVVVAALILGGCLWYRATGPRLDAGGFGMSIPVLVGEPAHVGVPLDASGGELVVRTARLAGTRDGAVVEWHALGHPGPPMLGSARGPDALDAYDPRPVEGTVVPADGEQWLAVTVTPSQPGVYRFGGLVVVHGEGLRRRTERFDLEVCVVAVTSVAEIHTASDRCHR